MATDTRLSKERSHKPSKQPRKHASAADPAPVSAVDRQPEAAAATRPVGAEPSAGPPSPPRVRRTEAGRRIRRIAAVTETLTARDHLIQLAEQVQAGANNPQRTRFIESAIGECLEDADAAAARGSSRLVWNRAYYACFHAATAVLVARDRRFRKHRGLIKAVHEDLVAEGFLAAEQAVAFEGLYAQRLDADYGDFLDIPREQVENTLATARRLVAAMQLAVDATRRP